jgi:hypothetical protein
VAAYFHPCRLYMGEKLGPEVDWAARQTLYTIWGHFIEGGFRHDAAWSAYGPYLTLQLAHAFLFIGDLSKMAALLAWSEAAAFPTVREPSSEQRWVAAQAAWNEQHCYPIATDFAHVPGHAWYMGDMPHGWAAAEYVSLLRDMCFFEADEDGDPHIYIAPGLLPEWLEDGRPVEVAHAPTCFGTPFGYRLTVDRASSRVKLEITEPAPAQDPAVRYVFRCPLGSRVVSVNADRPGASVADMTVTLPAGVRQATITFA